MSAVAVTRRADRLDQWLVAHGHAATRRDAQAMIMAGLVTVEGALADKPGRRITARTQVAVQRRDEPYASRGGLKLAHALTVFDVDVRGKIAVDLGASTGGFTDCLLRAGASRVYAVDVGRGLLAWRLRTDPRVVILEGRNARAITPDDIGGSCDLVTADLAFISLRLLWKPIARLIAGRGSVIALVKPQFEAGRDRVGRGGVVRDADVHRDVLRTVLDAAATNGLAAIGVVASPILGPAGNVEFLVHLIPDHLATDRGATVTLQDIDAAVARAPARPSGRRSRT